MNYRDDFRTALSTSASRQNKYTSFVVCCVYNVLHLVQPFLDITLYAYTEYSIPGYVQEASGSGDLV